MIIMTIVGTVAAVCTTISFLPQVIKTLKTKQTKDISLSMYIILLTGIFLWLIYGIYLRDLPIMLSNLITFILALIVLVMKLKNG